MSTPFGIFLKLCNERVARLSEIAFQMNRSAIWEGDVELAFNDNEDTDREVLDALRK